MIKPVKINLEQDLLSLKKSTIDKITEEVKIINKQFAKVLEFSDTKY